MKLAFYVRYSGGPLDGERRAKGACDCCGDTPPELINGNVKTGEVSGTYRRGECLGSFVIGDEQVHAYEYIWEQL